MNANAEKSWDLIFVSMEDWDDIWRRNQFVCAGFARRFPDQKILFVGLARDVSNRLRRLKFAELRGEATRTVPDYPNITVTRPLKFLPNSLTIGRRINDRMFRAHVRKVAARLGMKQPVLWLNPHSAVHMAGRMGERAVIYDITDDWISLTQSEALTRLTTQQDALLCKQADAVIVCSQKLFDLKKDLARNLHLIPNGVDAEHYSCVVDGTGPLPKETQAWTKPVLGYTGTIHPDRVDLPLIEEIAKKLTSGSIALIGPSHVSEEWRERLAKLGNVYFTGPVPYARLPQMMRAFDICITPHRVTPFTESLNPIKLWEYLAAGKPILSTDVAGFRDYPQFVRIVSNAEEFVTAIHDALHEAPDKQAERRRESLRHSWEARLDAIMEVIESSFAQRSQETTNDN